MKWNWEILCGRNNSGFEVWNGNDFGHCFEQLIFVCASHAFLAIASAYHFSRHQERRILGPVPHSPTLHIRLVLAVCLVLSPVFLITLTLLYLKVHPSLIDIISWALSALSWLIHSSFLHRLKRLYHIHIRGPIIVVLSFFLTTASMIIQLRTVILHRTTGTGYFTIVEEIVTYIMSALHTLYILTLIPWRRPALSAGHWDVQGINNTEENQSLLTGEAGRHQASYGTIPSPATPIVLGVAQDKANILSKLFFWWVQPLMLKGSKGGIENCSDLFHLPRQLGTRLVDGQFKASFAALDSEVPVGSEDLLVPIEPRGQATSDNVPVIIKSGRGSEKSHRRKLTNGKKHKSLKRALNKTFGLEFYSLGILKFIGDGLSFAGPILLNYLVLYMENKGEPDWHGYLYASLLCITTFLSSMFSTHFDYLIGLTGMKIRTGLITAVYRKTISVSSVSLSKFSSGEVVNFMSTDTDRIVNFCPSFHQFWSLPVQVIMSLYLLYNQVGLAFLAGLGFILLIIPLNKWIANKIGELSTDMMEQKDGRVKVMTEILYGIRVIKYYAWEPQFSKRINVLREAELKSLRGRKYLDALCVFFWATTPVLISVLTFMTYSLMGNELTAAKVFTSMALFNMLIMPLNAFPWVLNGVVEALVSVKRLENFIMLDDVDLEEYYSDISPSSCCETSEPAIHIREGGFSWTTESSPTDCSNPSSIEVSGSIGPDGHEEDLLIDSTTSKTLRLYNINISIPKGQLIGVVGKVGSGKSSLLSAIAAEMYRDKGEISVASLSSGFGLAAQEPWIQHASLRENILFGKPYEQVRYNQVIDACALTDDLKVLPAGDQTEIGENGVTLSGGQKARVSLARAVYQDKEVYLMDDPLAAVDAHVARHLFDRCIMGLLREKSRVLCTHHVHYLQDADMVLLMENGTIQKAGSPEDILNSVDLRTRNDKQRTEPSTSERDTLDINVTSDGSLVTEEEKDTGVVKGHVYMAYWRAVGKCLAPMVLIALFLMQASRNLSDWWLSYWVTHSHHLHSDHNGTKTLLLATIPDYTYRSLLSLPSLPVPWRNITESEDNVKFYLTVFGIIAACNTLFTFARAFLFAYGGICAATVIHEKLLGSILRAPVGFFDVTPIGRVVNRFSSDQYSVDDSLPFILNIFLAQLYGVIGTLVITCYGLPWFTIMLVPLGIFYYFVQRYYRQTSRELKRLSSITLSPIYAHFSETITGLSTIRALRETERFLKENQERLEMNQRAVFCGKAASKWLAIRLQMMGVAMVTGVALIAVVEHHFQTVNAGLVGLAISYALSVTSLLNGVVVWFTETEMQMVSMERASQYIHDVPQERDWSVLNAPPYWPIQGAVSFQHVCLQYRPSLPLALNTVTFETQPAEKIGIVGRTGSGKSSLFLTLFRMVEIQSGQIFIDGINVSHLPLNELRSRMAIIPQDPFLFSGSVRENLDPASMYSDRELWTALERCHLTTVVCSLGGLEAEVAERGRHFSVGQRQLLCLARALLTQAKVLCIDEATASVDQETDSLIQQTIREEFRDDTVLTIAHRINTILDSDRVIVMHGGSVAEFDKPASLLEKTDSMFYGLVHGQSIG